MTDALLTALIFLVQVLFDIYIFMLMLRLIMQATRVTIFHPALEALIKFTNPIVKPLQKILPTWHNINIGIIIGILLLEIIKLSFISYIQSISLPNFSGIIILAIASALNKLLNFYFYAIIIRIIISWLAPTHHNPFFFVLYQMTEPLLHPARRMIPPVGGIDLSPMIVLLILQILSILLMGTLSSYL